MSSGVASMAPKRQTHHLLIFAVTVVVAFVLGTVGFIYFTPTLTAVKRAIVQRGLGSGSGIPVNTLYTVADLPSPSNTKSNLLLRREPRHALHPSAGST